MRILTFSDWRVQELDLPFRILERLDQPVDLILYAGDDINRFVDDGENVFSQLAAETRLGKVLAVRGNDDFPVSGTILEDAFPLEEDVLEGQGVHDLHQEPYIEGEYVFLGLEGAIEGGPGLTLHSEEDIDEHLREQYSGYEDKIPVVVSHVPPNGILDIGQRFGQRHIGSTSLRTFVEEVEPVVTICGHCHQFGGRAAEEDFGTVINIASHDSPRSEGRYGLLELDGSGLEYELTTTEEGADHQLFQLSQVGGRSIHHFLEAGISDLDDITEANRSTLLELPGVYDWHVDRLLAEAEAIRDDEFRVINSEAFEFLQQENTVLVDIETDLSQDRIWLVGLYSYRDDEFSQIFEKDDEEKLLDTFIGFLKDHDEPAVVYYGNNRFDEECLKWRMEAHEKEEGLLLMDPAFDLGIEVNNNLLGSFKRTNLDSLSKELANYEYSHPEIDGFVVGSRYTRYLLDGEEPNWDELLEYNRDDVLALKAVADELRKLL
jgi:Icc-related predicted phosphoesterase